eukprot:269383_1
MGQKHYFPLLTYLVDLYARYRLLKYQKLYEALSKIDKPKKRAKFVSKKFDRVMPIPVFFKKCFAMQVLQKKKNVNHDASSEHVLSWYEASMSLFFRRFLPPLRMSPLQIMHKINDSIFVFARYYIAMLVTVDNLLKNSNTKLPLQIDFWVIPKQIQDDTADNEDEDDDFESSSNDESASDDELLNENINSANIMDKDHLKKRFRFTDNLVKKDIAADERTSRTLFQACSDVIKGERCKRMVIIVDRREGIYDVKASDKLYAYLPTNSQDIPSGNYLEECMLHLSRLEVLPSENGQVNNNTIHVISDVSNMCLLSLHIHSENSIRAYWYINGSYTRWFPNDLLDVWPIYFVDEYDLWHVEKDKYANRLVSGCVSRWCYKSVSLDIIKVIRLLFGDLGAMFGQKMVTQKKDLRDTRKLVKSKSAFIPLRDANFDAFFEANTRLKPENTYLHKL